MVDLKDASDLFHCGSQQRTVIKRSNISKVLKISCTSIFVTFWCIVTAVGLRAPSSLQIACLCYANSASSHFFLKTSLFLMFISSKRNNIWSIACLCLHVCHNSNNKCFYFNLYTQSFHAGSLPKNKLGFDPLKVKMFIYRQNGRVAVAETCLSKTWRGQLLCSSVPRLLHRPNAKSQGPWWDDKMTL